MRCGCEVIFLFHIYLLDAEHLSLPFDPPRPVRFAARFWDAFIFVPAISAFAGIFSLRFLRRHWDGGCCGRLGGRLNITRRLVCGAVSSACTRARTGTGDLMRDVTRDGQGCPTCHLPPPKPHLPRRGDGDDDDGDEPLCAR